MAEKIKVATMVDAPMKTVWETWNDPKHIVKWNQASEDWHTTEAKNDLRNGGKFLSRMEAKDGSVGFDFEGIYDEIIEHKKISYTMPDKRQVEIRFSEADGKVKIEEWFDAEDENPVEMQKAGWQAIMDSYTHYTESI
ncbi:SRPBCC family protein [Jeotgalibaca sp. A127]|uniref:SRPBCC family protein n=1 Tax=Jeotgalibaca sp. A127 TaxID=3457324 RepID=UPI003FD52689